MKALILFFLAGENMRQRYETALDEVGGNYDLRMVIPGSGSRVNEAFVQNSPAYLGETRLERVAARMLVDDISRYSKIMLVGFSAGYGAVRYILEENESADMVDGVVLLDGLHDSLSIARLDWLERYARRALAGETELAIHHTDVPTYGYSSTTQVTRELCRRLDLIPPETNRQVDYGGVTIVSHDLFSATDAKKEHSAALTTWGPAAVAETFERVDELETVRIPDPPQNKVPQLLPITLDVSQFEHFTLGERCCAWLGFELGVKPAEQYGAKHDPRILRYSSQCRRGGDFLGVDEHHHPVWSGGTPIPLPRDEDAWCAAFQSACLVDCLLPDEDPPHGLRVSVRELVEDARESGTLRHKGETPKAGWLAILKRVTGQSPMAGGQGHVRAVIYVDGSRYFGIGGNESNTVVGDWYDLNDARLEGWIER